MKNKSKPVIARSEQSERRSNLLDARSLLRALPVNGIQCTGRALAMTTIIIFLIFAPQVFADSAYLASGDIVKGVVVEEHCDRIVLSTYKGEAEILNFSIDQIFFDNEEQNYAYLGDKALNKGEFGLALGLYQKSAQINPDYERVHGAFLRLTDALSRQKLNIKPQDAIKKLDEQLGINIEKFKDKIRAGFVRNDSSAAKAGISAGDVINNVWDASLMFMDTQSAAEIMLGAPSTPVRLTLEKNITLPVGPLPWYKKIFSFLRFHDFGFKLSLRPSGLSVVSVKPDSVAYKSGFIVGDEITRIDNEPVRYMPVSMVRKKIFESKLKNVVITIKRQAIVIRE